MFKKKFVIIILLFSLVCQNTVLFAAETKYPNYAQEFLGTDKYEKINRKVFNFNRGLNKYAIRPIHTIWSSIMPKYGMDRIYGISNNIEYPVRLISSLIQRDFQTSKNESIRFFTNTILGLGGMFDPAKHLFHLEQSKENMEQALAACNVSPGQYFVMPVLSFTTPRGLFGKLFDTALNPSCYIATPILAIIKAGLLVNRTSYLQPLFKMVEANYADPYEIAKEAYGIDNYIKQTNKDRQDVMSSLYVPVKEEKVQDIPNKQVAEKKSEKENIVKIEVSSELLWPNLLYGGTKHNETGIPYNISAAPLEADKKLYNYNPQNPVVDSMRTALFALPGVDESIWNELSIWNRSFSKRIKTSSINITEGRDDYKYRYILQKTQSPLVVIIPSIGEGIMSGHSVLIGKIFYDAGYSVLIESSNFNWEFVKSMPENYRPGLPAKDADALKTISAKIINHLEEKQGYKFGDKVFVGTSFGALTSLFLADKESRHNTLGNTKFISICPPVDLIYAMKQVDKNSESWSKSSDNFKERVAETAAKVVKLYESKKDINFEINNLPFTEDEGKLITGFVMHQKLSDLIYTIENSQKNEKDELYYMINNMGYQDYAEKYLLSDGETCDDLIFETSLSSISSYLENNSNYKIYHSLNDYLTNKNQLKLLKQSTGNKTVLFDNGAHLGFLYRQEFIEDLKDTIKAYFAES